MKDPRTVAEAVRRACLDAALRAYEDAGLRGLCQQGRWECAVEAIRRLDLDPVVGAWRIHDDGSTPTDRPPTSSTGSGRDSGDRAWPEGGLADRPDERAAER